MHKAKKQEGRKKTRRTPVCKAESTNLCDFLEEIELFSERETDDARACATRKRLTKKLFCSADVAGINESLLPSLYSFCCVVSRGEKEMNRLQSSR